MNRSTLQFKIYPVLNKQGIVYIVKEDKLFGSDKHLMKSLSKELKSLANLFDQIKEIYENDDYLIEL